MAGIQHRARRGRGNENETNSRLAIFSGWLARATERRQAGLIFNWASGNPRTIPAGALTYAGGQNTLDNGQRRSMIVSPLYNPSMSGHAQWKGDSGLCYGDNWVRVVDPQCQVMNVTDSMGYNMFTDNRCDLNAVALKNGDRTVGPILLQNPLPGQMGNHTTFPFRKWKVALRRKSQQNLPSLRLEVCPDPIRRGQCAESSRSHSSGAHDNRYRKH